jgi:trehalose 6-phosphate synthase
VTGNHIDEHPLNARALKQEGDPVNLVVVSNRVARGTVNEPMTGGLAAALLPVVERSGAIWVGSSGRVRDGAQKEPFAEIEALGAGALAMLDLPAAHYGGYYEGLANSALWPALHSRADLIRASQAD